MIGKKSKNTVLPNIEVQNSEIEQAIDQNNKSIKTKFFNSTLQFFVKPIKTERILLKIVWLALLLISIALNLYYVILNIIDFFHYDITTSINTINEKESQFPTISFCDDLDKNFSMIPVDFWFNYKNLTSEWKNHIEKYNDSVYGNCYRFNSGRNMYNQLIPIQKSKKPGFDDGLKLDLYSNSKIDFSQIIIYIHNHTQTLPTIQNKGFWMTSGSENYFYVNRIYDEKLPEPYNQCLKNVSDWPFNKSIIEYLKTIKFDYTQKECIIKCRTFKSMETNCNCSISNLNEKFRVKCVDKQTDENIKNCSMKFLAEFDFDICTTSLCPLECDSYSYEINSRSQVIVSSAGNLSAYFDSRFKTFDQVAKSYYGIYVYFDDLKYTHMKQLPKMEKIGLVSNIGGTFSLFLGLSFFSFLEIFEILAELILNRF